MATLPNSTTKTLTLSSSSTFLRSYKSYSDFSPQASLPCSFDLLSAGSPLPPIPPELPRFKIIPRTRFIVDGFRCSGDFSVSYFLSHFHSDHYTGLGPNWSKGIIFCSEITARLLVDILKVPPFFVASLSLNETVEIDGCDVAVVDANHCPGAVQFLFVVPGTDERRSERYIHTGDFRYCDWMKSDPCLCKFIGADAVFLDTTYCNPKYVFPSQKESVEYVVETVKRIRAQSEGSSESILFLIATYVVGKEKILLEISRHCGCLLYVDDKKMQILSILGHGDSGVFTEDVSATNVHVIGWNLLGETWPYFRPNFVKMKEIMTERGYSKAVGFVATGWMYETKRDGFAMRVKESLEIHLVPYSEHSSYDELREYVRFLRPKHVIPTVGVDVEKLESKHSLALQKHFSGLVDETANKHEFLMAFHQKSEGADMKSVQNVSVSTNEGENVGESKNPVLEVMDSEKESNLRELTEPGDVVSKGAMEDLRDCLPSWVTQDQILSLLRSSGGDVVEAVSDFFEHERELYEQVNDKPLSTHISQTDLFDDSASHLENKCTQVIPDCGAKKVFSQDKRPTTAKFAVFNKPSLTKKRTSSAGNKPKKRGRSHRGVESSGCKQSTITKYFGKVFPGDSCDDCPAVNVAHGSVSSCQHVNIENQFLCSSDETYMKDLDHFLQIINDGIPRNAAMSLLKKAKGNIDVAVDLYYDNVYVDLSSKETSILQDAQPELSGDLTSSHAEKATCFLEKTMNLSTLFVHGASDDTCQNYISLSIEKYSPVEHACWNAGEPAPYLHLARTFDLVEREKGRLKTSIMLCNMFRSLIALSPEDVLPAVYLCTNRIAADHENMELNIGGNLVVAALEEACGVNKSKIKEMYNVVGDLGDVAQECRQTQSLLAHPRPLSIRNLFQTLQKISLETGNGSAIRRKNLVMNLMRSCRGMEMKFLVRTLVRNLRIGAMMKTILPALAHAVVLNSYSLEHPERSESLNLQLQAISAAVADAYDVTPNLDLLIPALLNKGIKFSALSLAMLPGTPIPPMLARITNGITQVLKLFQGRAFTCEFKYDGQRAQIHRLADGSVKVFSRQMKETTARFPDLINIIKEFCKPAVSTFIIDAEIVGVDRKIGNKLMSFQELSSRERGSKNSSISMDSIKVFQHLNSNFKFFF
ncbi:DNA ligase 6 isoform X1 [Dioscorea cayenensis subsp. rotundata]|uniref:DNA ligase 6 isoform X1 n=1 Tax=Dioscorea cayennensis subsp. rotundata TaxID=55577 RepID=A0AB40B4T3_DIOCR|nr:DNA ligase 6 isoform X1 [Dioscorea cayenensis subsp. rotundata]